MQLQKIVPSVFKPLPPPLWLVTNGELTVGPVATNLLMRGFEAGRVPDYCHVRAYGGKWRNLYGVREIAALTGKSTVSAFPGYQAASEAERLSFIRDEEEFCHHITRNCLIFAGAESAMFHLRGRSTRALITRAVVGPISNERLGLALREDDLVLRAARGRRPVLGPPYGPTEDALAIRFAGSRGGVGGAAMIPFFVAGQLVAMLELSRPGHAFRRADLQRAERIVQRALFRRVN